MPNHDYRCAACRGILRDQYRSIAQGGKDTAPPCPRCGGLMTWVIPRLNTDLKTDGDGGKGFQKFHARDGHNQLVEIDSLHKLRQVERESEQLARNGEGQVIRFRAYEQNHSNMSVNVFGERPADAPDMTLTAAGKQKFGLQGATTLIDASGLEAEPEYTYGPGVNDSNASALGGLD